MTNLRTCVGVSRASEALSLLLMLRGYSPELMATLPPSGTYVGRQYGVDAELKDKI